MSGIQGRLNKQFAVTIAISVLISAFNALTLSPALSAMLLKPRHEAKGPLARFFGAFNRWLRPGHPRLRGPLPRSRPQDRRQPADPRWASPSLAGGLGRRLPTGFVPDEDQGYLLLNVQLPDAASFQRTNEVTQKIEKLLARTKGVHLSTTINGFSLLTRTSASYTAFFFVSLDPWDERRDPSLSYRSILATLNRTCGPRSPRRSPSPSRPPPSPASAPRAASRSGSRTGAAARWSS